MRILFLHEVNYLEKPIFEMHEFPEHLAGLGHEVAFVQFPEGLSMERVKALGWKTVIPGRVLPQQSLTLYTPQNASGTFLGRLKTALTFSHSFYKVIEDFSPDVVVSFSVPTSGWQALRASKKFGIPYVFRALDVSHKIRKTPFSFLVYLAERYTYRNADAVSVNNPAMASYCKSMGANPEKTFVDLPPLDLGHFHVREIDTEAARSSLGLKSSTRAILYMGSFFYFSGLPDVIRRFAELKPKDTQLVLLGGGEQDEELRKLVATLGLHKSVTFTGYVSFTDLPAYLSVADVAINPMHRSLVSNAAFPNKVIQYMASALPVASTRLEGLEKTFGDLPGLQFAEESGQVLDRALLLLAQGNLNSLGKSNRFVASQLFSRDVAIQTFEDRLQKVMDQIG